MKAYQFTRRDRPIHEKIESRRTILLRTQGIARAVDAMMNEASLPSVALGSLSRFWQPTGGRGRSEAFMFS